MNYSILKQTETRSSVISLCSDGIVRVMGKSNEVMDEKRMQHNIAEYNKMIDGKSYAFLYYTEDDTFVFGSDAIRYAKSNQDSFPKTCIAVMVKNLAQKIVANFYLKFSPQKSPMRIFTNMRDAEAWCLQQYKLSQKTYSSVM